MTLEGMCENSQTQLAQTVDAFGSGIESGFGSGALGSLDLLSPGQRFQGAEVRTDIARARCEDHADVAVGRLGAQGWTEDAEEVEVGEVVYLPFRIYAVNSEGAGAGWFSDAAC